MEWFVPIAGLVVFYLAQSYFKRRNDTRMFIKILAEKPKREAELREALENGRRFGEDPSEIRRLCDQHYASKDRFMVYFIDKYGPGDIDVDVAQLLMYSKLPQWLIKQHVPSYTVQTELRLQRD
jgi:hypothetical protein